MIGHVLDWFLVLSTWWLACVGASQGYSWARGGRLGPAWLAEGCRSVRSVAVAAAMIGVADAAGVIGSRRSAAHQGTWSVAETLVLVVWMDVHFWCAHRLLHTGWLWRFHAVHHRSVFPGPLAGLSFHAVEAAMYFLSPVTASPFVPRWVTTPAMVGLVAAAMPGHLGVGTGAHHAHHARHASTRAYGGLVEWGERGAWAARVCRRVAVRVPGRAAWAVHAMWSALTQHAQKRHRRDAAHRETTASR